MQSVREKVTLWVSAIIYLLFNMRVGPDLVGTLKATSLQILQTAPYAAGFTYVIISFLQYMADGEKLPWDRQLRLFFLIGIMTGLFFGIYEYAGESVSP